MIEKMSTNAKYRRNESYSKSDNSASSVLACPNIPDIVEAAIIAVYIQDLSLVYPCRHTLTAVTSQPSSQYLSEGVFFVQIKCDIFYGSADNKMTPPFTFCGD